MAMKVLILLWKDIMIRKNHCFLTLIEVGLPILILVLANVSILGPEHSTTITYINDTVSQKCQRDDVDVITKILYEPDNKITQELMANVKCHGGFKNIKTGNVAGKTSYNFGIRFKNMNKTTSQIPNFFDYEIFPTTQPFKDLHGLWVDSTSPFTGYTTGSLKKILQLQHSIDYSLLKMHNISSPQITMLTTEERAYEPGVYELVIILTFFFTFSNMMPGVVSKLVHEKANGSKELMLMMGVKRWELWLSKLLDILILQGFVLIIINILLFVPLKSASRTITHISPVVVFLFFLYGLLGIVAFLFWFSCFFKNATLGSTISQGIWACTYVLFLIFSYNAIQIGYWPRLLSCLLPHMCLLNAATLLVAFDSLGKSISLGERLSSTVGYINAGEILLFMTVNLIIYSILTWYTEKIKPGPYGVPKSPWFFLEKSYWAPKKISEENNLSFRRTSRSKSQDYEEVPVGLDVGISIQKICKEYKSLTKGSILAVDNVSIDFYRGEISALLGHNGAGKTTIFSIVTGMTYPTTGRVILDGYDVGLNTELARSNLGLCPQRDMLFDDLTVLQILVFYGMIKGLSKKKAAEEANEYIRKLRLRSVLGTKSMKLSGGQKRKVSLAIALIGGSEVVVLDEPTSGLDPEVRREIWELLLELRGSRTILITTHFLEEADALSNRIAIMDHGKIKCYGTPIYLKKKYGSGYTLSIVLTSPNDPDSTDFVIDIVPSAKFKSRNVNTINYTLPEQDLDKFPALLAELSDKKANKEIVSYSLAFSTFEDVFLKVRDESLMKTPKESSIVRTHHEEEVEGSEITDYFILIFRQIRGLLMKKYIYFSRTFVTYIIYTVLPLVVLVVSYCIIPAITGHLASASNTGNETDFKGSLEYSLQLYPYTEILYSSPADKEDGISLTFVKLIKESSHEIRRVNNIEEEIKQIYLHDFNAFMKKRFFQVAFDPIETKIYFNKEAVHVLPISMNVLYNSFLKAKYSEKSIKTGINLQNAHREEEELAVLFSVQNVYQLMCKIVNFPDFVGVQTTYYLMGPINEKNYGAKQLQLMSTSALLYWIVHLVFDFFTFFIYAVAAFLLFWIAEKDEFLMNSAGIVLFFRPLEPRFLMSEAIIGLIFWGICLILIVYIFSILHDTSGSAATVYLIVYFTSTYFVYAFTSNGVAPEYLKFFHPSCILKMGFLNKCSGKKDYYILWLAIYAAGALTLLILIDSKIIQYGLHLFFSKFFWKKSILEPRHQDRMVKEHDEYVKSIVSSVDVKKLPLVVHELKRWFCKGCRPRTVVKGISFATFPGECFGLLGVNGAGKTSTFRMLTGGLNISGGKAFIKGTPLRSYYRRGKAFKQVGYCPQQGGFIPHFRGIEMLQLFGRLKGLQEYIITDEAIRWIEDLDLLEHSQTPVQKYSGGNQRKFCIANALMGNPSLIFLDEPTSGVDPVTRRAIWDVIGSLRHGGKSIVLTSHSMDECEALCSRLAIMVNGSFRCNGEITTLKSTFGEGFSVQLKITPGSDRRKVAVIKKEMTNNFGPECNLTDEHLTVLQYHVTNPDVTWEYLFTALIKMKSKFEIMESFIATSTTLEEIFIKFAREK